jgi:hypothetical protein
MGLGMDPRFDLSKAYWIVAAIAGVDPNKGSVASTAWAKFVVDGDLSYQIDAREIPTPVFSPKRVVPTGIGFWYYVAPAITLFSRKERLRHSFWQLKIRATCRVFRKRSMIFTRWVASS